MASKDQEIRLAIKGLIKGLYPDAHVFSWNALSHKLGEWPGLFTNENGEIHGWIIKRRGTTSSWKSGRRDRRMLKYDVWAFYKYETGKEDDNSDNVFGEIIDAVYDALKENPTLEVGEVEGHELLQLVNNTTIDTGEITLHFAQHQLDVRLCC